MLDDLSKNLQHKDVQIEPADAEQRIVRRLMCCHGDFNEFALRSFSNLMRLLCPGL